MADRAQSSWACDVRHALADAQERTKCITFTHIIGNGGGPAARQEIARTLRMHLGLPNPPWWLF